MASERSKRRGLLACIFITKSSVIVWESVPEVGNVGEPISIKLATEVGLGEIFQKPKWFCLLPFSSRVSGGWGGGGATT